ncbi:MAG: response regulator [Deltaproteobacteria bacterium]|jgi:signal transduction histidine kinase/CheY-like chemotaxis protein|nr:response regulator [Deltaproteobacteria bacterium]
MPLCTRWSNFRTSFQFKLFLIFTLLTLLITSLLSVLYIVTENHKAHHLAAEQLQLRTQQLAESIRLPLYAENREMLRQLAEQAAQAAEIRAVVITAPDGRMLAGFYSPDYSATAESISQSVSVQCNPQSDSVESSLTGGHGTTSSPLGSVRMVRGTADLSRARLQVVMISTSAAIAFWLTVSLLCHLVLRRVTRSFNTLVYGINAMQDGNFISRIGIESDDEPGRAARAVNNLADALQQRDEENRRLQEERMNLERQMLQTQKLESLGVMAGGIAHDFNNLLQAILGNIELASMKLPADAAPQKYIANAITSGKHAAHLTNLMLTYLGKGLTAKKELNLNELVRDNTEMLRTTTSAAVSTELHLSPELPAITADIAHIQQVVMNLISNAAESILEQPGRVRITTGTQNCDQACLSASLLEEKPESGRYVFLEVSDNGCGMSQETLQRLFDPFFTTKFTGRGLGMSAVMGIIRIHNGALFVESEPDKGTTFRALFPVSESAPPATAQEPVIPPSESTIPESSLSGLVLVVDDEKPVLKICTKMVQLCGFTVITACDGIDAVAKFREHTDEIAVVLMDLTMPNMDGLAAMSEIYLIRPDIKVIISSGFNKEELSERITDQPPCGFIRKPYSMNVLEAEMRRVMLTD